MTTTTSHHCHPALLSTQRLLQSPAVLLEEPGSRSTLPKPLLLLLPHRKLDCSNPTVMAELWEDQNCSVVTSCTFGHLLPSPTALSILQLGSQAGTSRLNPDPPRGFPHLCINQDGSQQLIPTSLLQFFSTIYMFPAQRWYLPSRSSMVRVCLILDFLPSNWICIPGKGYVNCLSNRLSLNSPSWPVGSCACLQEGSGAAANPSLNMF